MRKNLSINLLGISFDFYAIVGFILGSMQHKHINDLKQQYYATISNAETYLDYLISIDEYMKGDLIQSIIFWIVFALFDIWILFAIKKTLEDPLYISSELQIILTMYLIGIIMDGVFKIIKYIIFSLLMKDVKDFMLKWVSMDERTFSNFLTHWDNSRIIFNSVDFLIMIYFIVLSFLWFHWGTHITHSDLSRKNKTRLQLGFVLQIIANTFGMLGIFLNILRFSISKTSYAGPLLSWIALFIINFGRLFIGIQLINFPISELSVRPDSSDDTIESPNFVFCPYCGARLPTNSKVCRQCRRQIPDLNC